MEISKERDVPQGVILPNSANISNPRFSRRDFLRWLGITADGLVVASALPEWLLAEAAEPSNPRLWTDNWHQSRETLFKNFTFGIEPNDPAKGIVTFYDWVNRPNVNPDTDPPTYVFQLWQKLWEELTQGVGISKLAAWAFLGDSKSTRAYVLGGVGSREPNNVRLGFEVIRDNNNPTVYNPEGRYLVTAGLPSNYIHSNGLRATMCDFVQEGDRRYLVAEWRNRFYPEEDGNTRILVDPNGDIIPSSNKRFPVFLPKIRRQP